MKQSIVSKKLTSIMLVVVMLSAVFALAAPTTAEAAAKISKTKVTINEGKSKKLKVTGTTAKVKWTTSNKAVATVNAKGKVKGVKAGTATITGTAGSEKVTCAVTVKVGKTNVTEGFEKDMDQMNFYGSGSCAVAVTKSTTAAPSKNGSNFLKVSGRSDAWQGPQFTLYSEDGNCVAKAGKTYILSCWVRSDVIGDVEFKMTANVDGEYSQIAEPTKVKKGVWTKIEGEYTVPKNAKKVQPYVELLVVTTDFSIDDFQVREK